VTAQTVLSAAIIVTLLTSAVIIVLPLTEFPLYAREPVYAVANPLAINVRAAREARNELPDHALLYFRQQVQVPADVRPEITTSPDHQMGPPPPYPFALIPF
jgi:hypothetical protein